MTLILGRNQGSLEHAYHFWAAYFMPACKWLIDNPEAKNIKMIECGPMTHWLEHLQKFRDIEILEQEEALNLCLSGYENVVFEQNDDPIGLLKVRWLSHVSSIKSTFFMPPQEKTDTDIVIASRSNPLPFYLSEKAESFGAGAERRNIPNTDKLKDLFNNIGKTEIIDGTYLTAQETVDKFSNVKCIVGQHGAGLTNAMWMKPGSVMVEIRAPEKTLLEGTEEHIYVNMAKRLKLHYIEIIAQKDWFAPVNIELIKEHITTIKETINKL